MVQLHAVLILLAVSSPNPTYFNREPTPTPTPQASPAPVRMPSGPVIKLSIPLPYYHMTPTAAPRGYLDTVLTSEWPRSPGLQTIVPGQQLGAFDGQHLVAYVDETTGDSEVFTDLLNARPGPVKLSSVTSAASKIFSNHSIIPPDATTYNVSHPITLMQAVATDNGATSGNAGVTNTMLSYVTAQRIVDIRALFVHVKIPVYGPGSRVMVAIGADGSTKALLRRWRTASTAGTVTSDQTSASITRTILTQLAVIVSEGTAITVNRIGICYYDDGVSDMRPSFFYDATIHRKDSSGHASSSDHLLGFVPFTTKISQIAQPSPVVARAATKGKDPSIATYWARNSDPMWEKNANDLLAAVGSAPEGAQFTTNAPLPTLPSYFLDSQHAKVDGANIVDVEAHGDWWQFYTSKATSEPVSLANVPKGGYGNPPNASLSYLIFHSCLVVPSSRDLQEVSGDGNQAYQPWWNIFGGLHAVFGYRTEMYMDDDVGRAFGNDIGRGAPALSSWLSEVAASGPYQSNPQCNDSHLGHNTRCGMASAIVADGHQNDSMLADSSPLTKRPTKLLNFWTNN